jgi:mRNA interferase HigB
VHIISRKRLLEASESHADLAEPLDVWFRVVKRASWKTLVDTKRDFPTADLVGKLIVFNIKGNTYRLIAEIYYAQQVVLIRHVLTHAEYDRGGWK